MVRHRVGYRKLGKESKHRWAMLRNMVTSLIHHERIETTVPKAKELRRVAENMVQLAKRGDMPAKRRANAVVRDHIALHKLWSELGPNYAERNGGYTRILKSRNRRGDNAPMAYIEFVDREGELRPAKRPWDPKWKAENENSTFSDTPIIDVPIEEYNLIEEEAMKQGVDLNDDDNNRK
jgi:large subunit ribosomal protein L17